MRGRLLHVFLAEIHRLDRALMMVAPPESGLGFDPDFREPVVVDRDGDGIGERRRLELPAVRIPCQVEPKTMDDLEMYAAGNSPRSKLQLVMHFRDLERLDLVDPASGVARIVPGDRLGALHTRVGELVQRFVDPPGLFVTEARPIGWGLHAARPRRNLLLVTFEDRQQAVGRAR